MTRPSHVEISQLIEEVLLQKPHAQKSIYKFLLPVLNREVSRYIQNETDRKDIVQESFIKIFLNLKYYKGEGSFEGWARKITKNTAIHYFLKIKKIPIAETVETLAETNFISKNYYSDLLLNDLNTMVNKLPDGYKTVFNLYNEGYSHKEIASILNISEGTSKSQYFHAKKSLKVMMN